MPRIARVTAPLYPHHVTQRGNNREDVFFDDADCSFYLEALKASAEKYPLRIWAYCLMSNHVHLLCVPEKEESLARCVGRTNLVYTQYFNRRYGRSGRLWQNRFFSVIVETEPYLWALCRYIEMNPVKAGLVLNPADFRWSSCRAHVDGRDDALLSSQGWLDDKDRRSYKQFLKREDAAMDDRIRRTTSTGRPLADEEFIEKLEASLSRKLLPGRAGRPRRDPLSGGGRISGENRGSVPHF